MDAIRDLATDSNRLFEIPEGYLERVNDMDQFKDLARMIEEAKGQQSIQTQSALELLADKLGLLE